MTARSPYAVVSVPVTVLWVSPDRPRDVDRAAVGPLPDMRRWLDDLDAHPDDYESGDGRLGLHGRIESQLVQGEPVLVVGGDSSGEWAEVRCPWQPSPEDARGYPGWVPRSHLLPLDAAPGDPVAVADAQALDGDHPVLVLARQHLGVAYLWGGVTQLGFDCSGLVHHAWRSLGSVVPRDAWAQAQAAQPVEPEAVQPGDLYFFGHAGRRIHHVGLVSAPGTMVHASQSRGIVVEEALGREALGSLVAAGRLIGP